LLIFGLFSILLGVDESNHDHKSGAPVPEPKVFGDEELTNMIDPILKNDDKNGRTQTTS
jgi:hypothetical protein